MYLVVQITSSTFLDQRTDQFEVRTSWGKTSNMERRTQNDDDGIYLLNLQNKIPDQKVTSTLQSQTVNQLPNFL